MEGSGIAIDDLLLIVLALAVYALFAKSLARIWISAALFFTVVGTLASANVLGWYASPIDNSSVELLASIALATVLFGDATKVQLAELRGNAAAPARLLSVGLLGTVLLGTVIAFGLIGSLTWPVAMLLAVILAPTDAALGAAVVNNPAVPAKVREALFVESGLNDGLAVPLLVVALAWADLQQSSQSFVQVLALKLGVSAILGIALAAAAYAGLRLVRRLAGADRTWISLLPLLTAVACYLLAEHVGGSGFIAAFVGGIAFGAMARATQDRGIELDEAVSSLLQGATWFLFGALAVGPVLIGGSLQWSWLLYALLSLTVVRMIPVAIALLGTHQPPKTVLFMGWFGPRGLASVVFLLLVMGAGAAEPDARVLAGVVTLTVTLSIVLHGLTATPLSARFGRSQPG